MSIFLYGLAFGSMGIAAIGWYMWFDLFTKSRDIMAPFNKVIRSKGKKILLLVDSGAGSYKLVDAEREALGYTTKEFGNFEAYEEGIKPFGSGLRKVPLGLAHAELEVNITPAAAIWIKAHGGNVTQEQIDALPDAVQYLYCDAEITDIEHKEGKTEELNKHVCGWIGPLLPLEINERPSSAKVMWAKLVDASRDDNNKILPKLKPEEIKEVPTCPKCGTELKEVIADRTYSTIPNQVVYALHGVRKWVEEVVSPLNMEMAIESTKLNTMKKSKNNMDEIMKYIIILSPIILMSGLAYVMITSQGGGGGSDGGVMQGMGQTLKSGAGG